MTICVLVKAPERLVAVADGRLSITVDDKTGGSLDTARKIREFAPTYDIPHVAMGTFSHYSKYAEADWYLMYAGTYALVNEILDRFLRRMREGLILTRENGQPVIVREFDPSGRYSDDWNFRSHELPKITPYVIVQEFRDIMQRVADEWVSNRLKPADCEFILFGQDPETSRYVAYKVHVDPVWHAGSPVHLHVDEVKSGALAIIGSPAAARLIAGDRALAKGLKAWQVDGTFRGVFPSAEKILAADENWSVQKVLRQLANWVEQVGEHADDGIGGTIRAAQGDWMTGIRITNIELVGSKRPDGLS